MKIIASVTPVKALEKLILKAKDAYYNTGKFYTAMPKDLIALPIKIKAGPITDAIFDKLEDTLRELYPDSPILQQIGAPIAQKKLMTQLPIPMPSLNKKKPGTAQAWLDTHKGPYCESIKIDGSSLELVYKPNKPVRVYTRGDGHEGGDISFLAPYLKIPQVLPGSCIYRAEAVMKEAAFTTFWKTTYRNARNMVSGILNKIEPHPGLQHVSVIVLYQMYPAIAQSVGLKKAKSLGFTTVPYRVEDAMDEETLIEDLRVNKTAHAFRADGIVIRQDRALPPSRDNPDYAIAFKSNDADQAQEARVVSVSWNITRTGIIYPTINIEPTEFDGVTVKKASGKSAKFIVDKGIGPGALITLARSGDVIPDVRDILKKVKPQLPNVPFLWDGANLIVNKHGSDEIQALQIVHFFTTIGIDRFRLATVEKFVDAGYDSVIKILRMKRPAFISIPGGSKVLTQVWDQLQERIQDIPLPVLADASGIFGRGFGERRLGAIIKAIPNILEYAADPRKAFDNVVRLNGFDQTTATQFAEGLPKFAAWLKQARIQYTVPKAIKGSLTGQAILFTGFRNSMLEAKIKELGGEIAGSVGKATILLTSDMEGSSLKMAAARAKGIKIMTPDTFISTYLKGKL